MKLTPNQIGRCVNVVAWALHGNDVLRDKTIERLDEASRMELIRVFDEGLRALLPEPAEVGR